MRRDTRSPFDLQREQTDTLKSIAKSLEAIANPVVAPPKRFEVMQVNQPYWVDFSDRIAVAVREGWEPIYIRDTGDDGDYWYALLRREVQS